MLDIDTAEKGDTAPRFADYSRPANRDLIERAFNGTDFLKMSRAACGTYTRTSRINFRVP
jgi:hypothetical protein